MQTLHIHKESQEQICRDQVIAETTPRQLEVLHLFANGFTRKQVAVTLNICLGTVDSHKTKLFELCRIAWNLPLRKPLTYHFLHMKFAEVEGKEYIPLQSKALSVEEHSYRNQVIAEITPCQLEVLRWFANGLTREQVADQLIISVKTVDSHKTKLLALCHSAWNLDKHPDYHFLHEKFAGMF